MLPVSKFDIKLRTSRNSPQIDRSKKTEENRKEFNVLAWTDHEISLYIYISLRIYLVEQIISFGSYKSWSDDRRENRRNISERWNKINCVGAINSIRIDSILYDSIQIERKFCNDPIKNIININFLVGIERKKKMSNYHLDSNLSRVY